MIPVQKDQVLLVDNDEEGVNQLWNFAQNKELHPQSSAAVSVMLLCVGAKVLLEGVIGPNMYQHRERSKESNSREDGQRQVP